MSLEPQSMEEELSLINLKGGRLSVSIASWEQWCSRGRDSVAMDLIYSTL